MAEKLISNFDPYNKSNNLQLTKPAKMVYFGIPIIPTNNFVG